MISDEATGERINIHARQGNKRSQLEVKIGGRTPTEIADATPSEDRSQPRSMSYYEVPNTQRFTVASTPVGLPPPPPPNQDVGRRAYSQIDRSMQSRLI